MSRGQNPLIWMMAVSLPGAGHALGLGEIHVDSALNEPLAAEIDIVGATADDLIGLKAQVANRETFQQFGADRPNFLNTTTFKVTTDAKGHPVLSIRSSQAFTEPLVNFVVDLRWHNGELIRQYSLLLDPAGFPSAVRLAEALPVAPTQAAIPAPVVTVTTNAAAKAADEAAPAAGATNAPAEQPAQAGARKTTHIKVGAKATLRGVAWRVGARSESDLKQLMLAIFRANPSAFDNNINIMRLGALLTIPSSDEVAKIPKAEASREVHAQMSAWRNQAKSAGAPARPVVAPQSAPLEAKAATSAPAAPVAKAPITETPAPAPAAVAAPGQTPAAQSAADAEAEHAALTARVQSLEGSLHSLQAELETTHNKMLDLQAQARYADQHAQAAPAVVAPASHLDRSWLAAGIAGLAALAGICVALLRRLKRRPNPLPAIPVEAPQPKNETPVAAKPAPSPILRNEARIELTELELDRPEVGTPEPTPSAQTIADNEDTAEVDVHAALEAAISRDDAAARQTAEEAKRERDLERSRRADEEATMVREAIAAAWSIPDAEVYQRFDDTETTLAEALSRSMEDTVKLRQAAQAQQDAEAQSDSGETMVQPTDTALLPAATVNMPAPAASIDTAATLPLTPVAAVAAPAARMDGTKLDYNLVDLDQTNQHVHMPSMLHEHVVVKERRTNLIDVLKMAIEREPERSDLRMKLLETYYAAAATNRQGFLEVISKLAADRGSMSDEEWTRIQQMARQISADTIIPPRAEDDEDLANCA
jgi:FimV-like protein